MADTQRQWQTVSHLRRLAVLIPFAVMAVGCTTLPDVTSFADSTAGLATAASTHYRDVASDVAALDPVQLPLEEAENFQIRKKQIEDAQQNFGKTDDHLDALFAAMTTYSEKLASLAAAGKTGPEAAQSILDSVKGFANLAGLPAGTVAAPVAEGFKAIADEFTRMQARKSLKEAVGAAEPGVNLVAKQFEVIYGKAIVKTAESIRDIKRAEASDRVGSSIIGFNDNVESNYNAYYQSLNRFVGKTGTWRGFCVEESGPCRARDELEAVGLVEARMAAIRPIVASYEAEAMAIDATLKHRLATSKAVVKAVKAWALEHQKLRRSLEDGTSMSAFNLRSALVELGSLLGQKP